MTRALPSLAVLVALLASALLAACSDDDDDSTPTPTESATATASPTETTPTSTATASATATPQPEPSLAPDGRTGDPAIDGWIEALLTEDSAALVARIPFIEASYYGQVDGEPQFAPFADLAARFAAAERELYAVALRAPGMAPRAEYDITLAVQEAGRDVEGWRFAILEDRVVDLTFGHSPPSAAVPSVHAGTYDQFLVLPPSEFLPQPPPAHPISVRSGDDGVDALLSLLEEGDADGLVAAVEWDRTRCAGDGLAPCEDGEAPIDSLAFRDCTAAWRYFDAGFVESQLRELAGRELSLHAVADVPPGTAGPAVHHSLIVVFEVAPLEWETAALLEREGRIIGINPGCSRPDLHYPPRAVLIPPPAEGQAPDPGRRSGDAIVDAVLDALAAQDADALEALADYQQVGCIVEPEGIGQPPFCEDDESAGTSIDVLLFLHCHGSYARRGEAIETLVSLLALDDSQARWAPFAAVDLGADSGASLAYGGGTGQVVLVTAHIGDPTRTPLSLFLSGVGISAVAYGCDVVHLEDALVPGRAPSFLIAPPSE